MTTTERTFLLLLALTGTSCAAEHGLTSAEEELRCAPTELRAAWWSEGGPMILEEGPVFNATRSHLLVPDTYRPMALRLADGARSPEGTPLTGLTELAGLRYATPAYSVDAEGRHDLAGATEVRAIGTAAPLARIPWVVPVSASGFTRAIGQASQTSDRVALLEQAFVFGGDAVGLWLRVLDLSGAEPEQRIDLSSLPLRSRDTRFTMLFDEARDAILLVNHGDPEEDVSLTRVDLGAGGILSTTLALGPPAPVRGLAHVGEPPTTVLDVALSPDGAVLLITGRDGLLRSFDALTLEETRAPIPVGVQVANEDTFLPSLRSPIAFSPGGGYVALLDEAGEISVRESETLSVRATLRSAAPPRPTGPDDREVEAREMSLRFLPDGLVVVSDLGVERFACVD